MKKKDRMVEIGIGRNCAKLKKASYYLNFYLLCFHCHSNFFARNWRQLNKALRLAAVDKGVLPYYETIYY